MSRDRNVAGDIIAASAGASAAQRLPMVQQGPDAADADLFSQLFYLTLRRITNSRALKFTRTLRVT